MRSLSNAIVASTFALLALVSSACSGHHTAASGADAGTGGGSSTSGSGGSGPVAGPDGRYACDDGPYPVPSDARRLTVLEYQNAINDVFGGQVQASSKYPGSFRASKTGYSTEPAINDVGDQSVESLMNAAEDVGESVFDALPMLLPCSKSASAGATCAGTFIDTFVKRAYRRPLTDGERSRLLATYQGGRDSGASFSEAVAMIAVHAFQAPAFLYITEAAAPAPGRALDPYEIATRLSIFFWETIPDGELLAKADDGSLVDAAVIASEASRLLADPRADGALHRFFREWTQTVAVNPSAKDPSIVPGFDTSYAASMDASFDRYVADQGRNGTLATLLASHEAWVDTTMAGFFGVDAPASDWAKVHLDPARYSGLATQPAFLATASHFSDTAYSTNTSFVLRGRFVRKRLLCADSLQPPPDAQAAFQKIMVPDEPTAKEVAASIQANGTCGGCHAIINPAGLALEHFGALGQYREAYQDGKSIDVSGVLPAVGKDSITFTSNVDLYAALAKEPAVATCVAKQIVRYGVSRMDTPQDACAVQAMGDLLAKADGRIADALLAWTKTDAFTHRIDP